MVPLEAQRFHKWPLILFVWMLIRFEWKIWCCGWVRFIHTRMYKCKSKSKWSSWTHQYDILMLSLGLGFERVMADVSRFFKLFMFKLLSRCCSYCSTTQIMICLIQQHQRKELKGTIVFDDRTTLGEQHVHWEINMEHLQTLMCAVSGFDRW